MLSKAQNIKLVVSKQNKTKQNLANGELERMWYEKS